MFLIETRRFEVRFFDLKILEVNFVYYLQSVSMIVEKMMGKISQVFQ